MEVAYEGCTIVLKDELKLFLDNDLFAQTNSRVTLPKGAMAFVEAVEEVVFDENSAYAELNRRITAQFFSGVRIERVVLATYRYDVLPPLASLAAGAL